MRWFTNTGRVKAAWTSWRSNSPNAAPVPWRNSSTMMSIAFATHGTTAAHGFMHASLSSSSRTCACAFGSSNRRSSGASPCRRLPRRPRPLVVRATPARSARAMPAAVGQLRGRDRSRARERLVEAEPNAQFDVRELHRRETRAEQGPRELLDLDLVRCGQLNRRHVDPLVRRSGTTPDDGDGTAAP